jgi:hypothetical protein
MLTEIDWPGLISHWLFKAGSAALDLVSGFDSVLDSVLESGFTSGVIGAATAIGPVLSKNAHAAIIG